MSPNSTGGSQTRLLSRAGPATMIGESNPAPLCVRVIVAARMIGIGRTKLYELIGNGDVEVIKVGNATLIPTASLSAFVERQRKLNASL